MRSAPLRSLCASVLLATRARPTTDAHWESYSFLNLSLVEHAVELMIMRRTKQAHDNLLSKIEISKIAKINDSSTWNTECDQVSNGLVADVCSHLVL